MNSRKKHKGNATRSAGKQATGNRNKHLLAAERRRTDEPHGRLNKQNPVSPQNRTPNNKRTELSKTQAKVKTELDWVNEIEDGVFALRQYCVNRGDFESEQYLNKVQCYLNRRKIQLTELY